MLQSVLNQIPRTVLALLMSWLVLVLPVTTQMAQAMPVTLPSEQCATMVPIDVSGSQMPIEVCGADMPHWECADCDVSSCHSAQILNLAVSLSIPSSSPSRFLPWNALLTERHRTQLERPPRV